MSGADIELDDAASRALASIILERTADAVRDEGENAADALMALETDTGLSLDVCAGILQASSWLAGTGQIDPASIFAASLALQPEDQEVEDTAADYVAAIPQSDDPSSELG